jgi:hypothetical protein
MDSRIHHGLGACAVVKRDRAGALFADGVDEFNRLIIAKGDKGIARTRIAG